MAIGEWMTGIGRRGLSHFVLGATRRTACERSWAGEPSGPVVVAPCLHCIVNATVRALRTIRAGTAMSEQDELHPKVEEAIKLVGLPYEHEKRVAPRCRVDFWIEGVVVEIKRARPNMVRLEAQVARYADAGAKGLIIVTERGLGLPLMIGGVLVRGVALEANWGITV